MCKEASIHSAFRQQACYLKSTRKGKKHNDPAVQRQVKEDLDEYAVLMSDPSSSFFDDYDFDEYADLSKCAYRIRESF